MEIKVKNADYSAIKIGVYDAHTYSENYFLGAVTPEVAKAESTYVYNYSGAVTTSIINGTGSRNESSVNPDCVVSAIIPVVLGDVIKFSGKGKSSLIGMPAICCYSSTTQTSSTKALLDYSVKYTSSMEFTDYTLTITQEMVNAGIVAVSASTLISSSPSIRKQIS